MRTSSATTLAQPLTYRKVRQIFSKRTQQSTLEPSDSSLVPYRFWHLLTLGDCFLPSKMLPISSNLQGAPIIGACAIEHGPKTPRDPLALRFGARVAHATREKQASAQCFSTDRTLCLSVRAISCRELVANWSDFRVPVGGAFLFGATQGSPSTGQGSGREKNRSI